MRVLLWIVLLTLLTVNAFAHSWYDYACCSENDCRPAKVGEVTETNRGYLVRVTYEKKYMGETRTVTVEEDIHYKDARIKQSKDRNIHVCILHHSEHIRCVYIPKINAF